MIKLLNDSMMENKQYKIDMIKMQEELSFYRKIVQNRNE